MQNFSKDTHTCDPVDQNLYFAQNLPKRNQKSDQRSDDRAKEQKELRELKSLMFILKWILLIVVYPFHLIFQVVPIFIGKQGKRLFKKMSFYAEKIRLYFHRVVWTPIVRRVNKVVKIVMTPLKAAYVILYDRFQKDKEQLSATFRKCVSNVKSVILEIRQLFTA